jgi:hypothetical protein
MLLLAGMDEAEDEELVSTAEMAEALLSVVLEVEELLAATAVEELAPAVELLLESSLPVCVSPARIQPVLSVKTLGQVTCL